VDSVAFEDRITEKKEFGSLREDFVGYNVVDLVRTAEIIRPENEVCKNILLINKIKIYFFNFLFFIKKFFQKKNKLFFLIFN
jgi:hypothetical protein